ncbi:HD-GYP domain-containing protein [Leptospirillum sp. Group II 'CF-1']|uniref:HD-GYP domain-containing protein n=1 Tax=Leptospirillum sp. Group II 'CF-1' TaxID=1660083 RepID=UPI0018CED11E|nr:HD-GYP domain-containing protein [Leptospirillum sp. Group II 'CF-1']
MLDNWTFERRSHSYRVARLALLIGEKMGLSDRELFVLGVGSLLHDIGKMRVPREILVKPGKLTEDEWAIMRHHPRFGNEILKRFPSLAFAGPIVYQHQERWDGSGYPEGLSKDEIVPGARIFAVADSYDAMTNQRSYNSVKSAEEAVLELSFQAGILYDPLVIDHFLSLGNPAEFEPRIHCREESFLQEIFPMEGFVGLFASLDSDA